jgi:hypothetical protein
MARKCIRILMVVMIELYMFIVVKIQGNDLASISFAHSAPITLPYFSELYNAHKPRHQEPNPKPKDHEQDPKLERKLEHQEPKPTLYSCMTKKYEDCKKRYQKLMGQKVVVVRNISYSDCLFFAFKECLNSFEKSVDIESCIRDCARHQIIRK